MVFPNRLHFKAMNIVNLVDWLTARLVLNWADDCKSVKTRWQKIITFRY